jgi:hypothetical protein
MLAPARRTGPAIWAARPALRLGAFGFVAMSVAAGQAEPGVVQVCGAVTEPAAPTDWNESMWSPAPPYQIGVSHRSGHPGRNRRPLIGNEFGDGLGYETPNGRVVVLEQRAALVIAEVYSLCDARYRTLLVVLERSTLPGSSEPR